MRGERGVMEERGERRIYILETLNMTTFSSVSTSSFVPGVPMLMCIPQHHINLGRKWGGR